MATALPEPTQLLTEIFSAPPETHASSLDRVRKQLEADPGALPKFVAPLISLIGQNELLTGWILNLLEHGLCRSTLSMEIKTGLALQSLNALAHVLSTAPSKQAKIIIQIFSSIYALLFRHLCLNRQDPQPWAILSSVKAQITSWATTGVKEGGVPVTKGLRYQAVKFLQKLVLVQTKVSGGDPRLNNPRTDPNLSLCPSDHPFIQAAALEEETNNCIKFMLVSIYSSRDVGLITAIVNTFATIVKLRPTLAPVLIQTLTGWKPDALAGLPKGDIRSVEKVIKVTMILLDKSPASGSFRGVIAGALVRQAARMEAAYKEALEESRQQKRRLDLAAQAAVRAEEPASKRPRTDPAAAYAEASTSTPPPPPSAASTFAAPMSFPPSRGSAAPFPPAGSGTPPYPPSRSSSSTPFPPSGGGASPRPPSGQHPFPSTSTPPLAPGALFDVAVLPPRLVVDLLFTSLAAVSRPAISEAVRGVRQALSAPLGAAPPPPLPFALLARAVGASGPNIEFGEQHQEEQDEGEAINPLDLVGADDDDVEDMTPEQLEQMMVKSQRLREQNGITDEETEDSAARAPLEPSNRQFLDSAVAPTAAAPLPSALKFRLADFKLPPPRHLSSAGRRTAVLKSLRRIWAAGSQLDGSSRAAVAEGDDDETAALKEGPKRDLWMMLGARLVTRGREEDIAGDDGVKTEADATHRRDEVRRTICEFIAEDFATRYKFATLWLNEEWYNDAQLSLEDARRPACYRSSVLLVLQLAIPRLPSTFSLTRFLGLLPELPFEALAMVQDICTDLDRVKGRAAMKTLKDLTVERPPLRDEGLRLLLELCTHPDAASRNPAIATVRSWVTEGSAMADTIKTYARQLLRRLQTGSAEKAEPKEEEEQELPAQSRFLPAKLEVPVQQEVVRQHVELLFALTKKVPEFLDDIFFAYIGLDSSIQEAFHVILTPLIKSLGPNNGRLLTLLRTFPAGADGLALRTLQVLSEPKEPDGPKVKMSTVLIALVKSLVAGREKLDPRFMLPILPDLDKAEVRRQLPRLVGTLSGKPEDREVVRRVFNQILSTAVVPDLPKLRPLDQFTPSELMVLLHHLERDAGLKATMEAIDICFSLTDVYKSEVLMIVLQQLSDEPDLPTLFLRTVIKSVQTYKSLTSFVATNLLSRLIAKKVWTSLPLWDGFIRVAKILGSASYGALLQLPREQLKEIVSRPEPAGKPGSKTLKSGLREHVIKKSGGNVSRLPAWFAEVFPDEAVVAESTTTIGVATTPPPGPPPPAAEAAPPPVSGADGVTPMET